MWFLLACSSPPPTPAEAPPVAPAELDWPSTLGLMARSDEDACAGIEHALTLRDAGGDLSQTAGFRKDGGIHWTELSRAAGGGGPLEIALVTIGGVESLQSRPCLDLRRLANWLGRGPSLTKLGGCRTQATLQAMKAAVAPLEGRCVCRAEDPDPLPRLRKSLEHLDLDPTPWETVSVCPTTPEP